MSVRGVIRPFGVLWVEKNKRKRQTTACNGGLFLFCMRRQTEKLELNYADQRREMKSKDRRKKECIVQVQVALPVFGVGFLDSSRRRGEENSTKWIWRQKLIQRTCNNDIFQFCNFIQTVIYKRRILKICANSQNPQIAKHL